MADWKLPSELSNYAVLWNYQRLQRIAVKYNAKIDKIKLVIETYCFPSCIKYQVV